MAGIKKNGAREKAAPSRPTRKTPHLLSILSGALLLLILFFILVAAVLFLDQSTKSLIYAGLLSVFVILIIVAILVLLPAASETWRRSGILPRPPAVSGRLRSSAAAKRHELSHKKRGRPADEEIDLVTGRRKTPRILIEESGSSEIQEGARNRIANSRKISRPRPVYLGASLPKAARPGEEFTARFIAYTETFESLVESQLQNLSPRSVNHLRLKECQWKESTRVSVSLYGEHLLIPYPVETFVWNGGHRLLDFDVRVDPAAPATVTIAKFDVAIAGITVAKIRIDLAITPNADSQLKQVVKARPARTAFASYASEDRDRVCDRLSEIERNGIKVFLDCLSLHPGEEWKPRLEREIKNRELFLLFWSTYASQSEWVTWEWKTALREKGLSAIDPHPLAPEFEAPPPAELKSLHFNDRYMLVRKAYEHTAKRHPNKSDSP